MLQPLLVQRSSDRPTPAARTLTPLVAGHTANSAPDRTRVIHQSLVHILSEHRPPDDLRATVEALIRRYGADA